MNHSAPHRALSPARLLTLTLLILLALLLAACDDETPTPAAQADQPAAQAAAQDGSVAAAAPAVTPTPFLPQGDLVLWHSWAGPDADALTQILTQLKQEYPLLAVETLFVGPNDLPQAFADAIAAGGGPDLAVTQNWWINNMVDVGVVSPLDDLLQPGQADEFFAAALHDFQRDGTLYALPITFELVSLFQNTALTGGAAPPATTDALLAQAEVSPTLGIGLYANLYHVWWGFPAYGTQLFDPSGRVVLDASPGAADYLTWMKSLDASASSFVGTDYGELLERFTKGEFAYFVDGPWATAELRAALGESLAVAPLPAGPAGPAQPWLSADGVVLNPRLDAQRSVLAFFLASRLSSAESGTIFAAAAARLPANQRATLPDDPVLRGFMAQARTAQPAPAETEMEAVWGYGGDMLVKVLGGSMSGAQAVRETAALINEETGR